MSPGSWEPIFTSRSAGSTIPWAATNPLGVMGWTKSPAPVWAEAVSASSKATRDTPFRSLARGASASAGSAPMARTTPRKNRRKSRPSAPLTPHLLSHSMGSSLDLLEEAAVLDVHDPVAELENAAVVGDHHHGVPALVGELGQGLHHPLAGDGVERG